MNKRLILIVALLLSILLLCLPVFASTTITATYADGIVTVSGTGFSPSMRYTARIVDTANNSVTAMKSVTSGADGAISVAVTTGSLGALSNYMVRVNNPDGALASSCPITETTADLYTVSFESQGGSSVTSISASYNSTITAPTAPTKTGYTFGGWYKEASCTTVWNFGTDNVTSNISLYAKWTANTPNVGGGGGGSGGGGSSPPQVTTPAITTQKGEVLDGKTGQLVQAVEIKVSTETNGTQTVAVKSKEAILMKQPDGTRTPLGDYTKLGFSLVGHSKVTLTTDGTIQVTNLAKGSESTFAVSYDLGNGQSIAVGTMNIKVSSNGEVNFTATLIDPYGIITDPTTGKPISGANVTLYYANTARNKATGKKPDTLVPLPILDGFNPNNNKNPQTSDISGAYGFMVFPTSDYYIVATKEGYEKYKSVTISVEQDIVKWDFKMNKPSSGLKRLAGLDRIDTALEIAKASYTERISSVVLATAENYPDALAGSVLAYKLNAPILLVGSKEADQEKVLSYIKSSMNSNGTVYILGGTGAISSSVDTKLSGLGYKNLIRVSGYDRYETAAKITEHLEVETGTPIVLVYGENYPDALSISSVAAAMQSPILLVQKEGMSDVVLKTIADIKPIKVYIIGLQGVISTSVEDQVAKLTALDRTNIVRIGGVDRYETSLEVAKYFNLAGQNVCVATGNNYPDALSGSVYAANTNAPIILMDGVLSEKARTYLETRKMTGVTIFGGEAVVSRNIEEELSQLVVK